MTSRILLALVWVGLFIYAFFLAPPQTPDTWTLIFNISTGQLAGINPAIIALFNLMGVWPAIYASVLLIDGRMQKIWAWPFVAGSFAAGAFALLPYLIGRSPNQEFAGEKNWLLKIVDSRISGIVIAIAALVLVAYGIVLGDWPNFIQQWQTSRFIHVMSLDFCLLWLLFPIVLKDDMARRNLKSPLIFWTVSLTSVIGAAIYLALRPPLPEKTA